MESLALVNVSSGNFERKGPARSDPKALPLGAMLGTSSTAPASARRGETGAPQPLPGPQPTVNGCPMTLPPPPPRPPFVVLLPTTKHIALFFVPPPYITLVSGALMLLTLLGSWLWGWGIASPAGLASGVAAGVMIGVAIRSWPVGGWIRIALLVLGIAILGGAWPSLKLGIALWLATLWQNGWWLHIYPECAPFLVLAGMTADVVLGLLLASVLQVHLTQPAKPLAMKSSSPSPPADAAQLRTRGDLGAQWTAVTPPGIAGSRRRGRMEESLRSW